MANIFKDVLAALCAALLVYLHFKSLASWHDKPLVRGKIQTLFGNDLKQ